MMEALWYSPVRPDGIASQKNKIWRFDSPQFIFDSVCSIHRTASLLRNSMMMFPFILEESGHDHSHVFSCSYRGWNIFCPVQGIRQTNVTAATW